MTVEGTKKVVSVNVGQPREVETRHGAVLTSIFKSPITGKAAVRPHNIEGDRQADLAVHGGPTKAVYLYPHEHYAFWARELPGMTLSPGNFGENLTTEGIREDHVFIGDQFRIGTAVLQVTQPRMPCFKLGIRFGRADMVKRFWMHERPGIYFSIATEGVLEAGDAIERIHIDESRISVAHVVKLYKREIDDPVLIQRALDSPLSGSWKEAIRRQFLGDQE